MAVVDEKTSGELKTREGLTKPQPRVAELRRMKLLQDYSWLLMYNTRFTSSFNWTVTLSLFLQMFFFV